MIKIYNFHSKRSKPLVRFAFCENKNMGFGEYWGVQPSGSPPPLNIGDRNEHWRQFDNSVNAVSFGFVATAILISMFLVMAIFERFLRPNSPPASGGEDGGGSHVIDDIEAQPEFIGKLDYPSPKMTVYSKGVSVLMPGENMPSFIAHPAPMPCPPDRIQWPLKENNSPLDP